MAYFGFFGVAQPVFDGGKVLCKWYLSSDGCARLGIVIGTGILCAAFFGGAYVLASQYVCGAWYSGSG